MTGHAGAGTSVFLRRQAWDAATNHDKPVIHIDGASILRVDLIEEVIDLIHERLFVIVDDAPRQAKELREAFAYFRTARRPISFLLGGRTNEWNNYCDDINGFIDNFLDLDDLAMREIVTLIEKLEEHGCLGVLVNYSFEERKKIFADASKSNRQLLVALHQATEGKGLEEIAQDEYVAINPIAARRLYSEICTLNKFNAPVRAGLISRLSGINFHDFKEKFSLPLERVVLVEEHARYADYTYRARHSQIAAWVFERAFDRAEAKVTQLIRIIGCLNTDYVTDEEAILAILRGRDLAKTFDDKALVARLYDAAIEAHIDRSYVFHQRAVFELNHRGADLNAALNFVSQAISLSGKTRFPLLHTKAMVLRRLALLESNTLQKQHYREEVYQLMLANSDKSRDSRAHVLLVKTMCDALSESQNSLTNDSDVTSLISDIEKQLAEGYQRFSKR